MGHWQKGSISALGHQPQPTGSCPHSGTFSSNWCESQAVSILSLTHPRTQGFRLMLSLVYASSATASTSLVCFSVSLDDIFGVSTKCQTQHCTYVFSWLSALMAQLLLGSGYHFPQYMIFPGTSWNYLMTALHRVDRINSHKGDIPSGLQLDPGRTKPKGFLSWPNERISWKWLDP